MIKTTRSWQSDSVTLRNWHVETRSGEGRRWEKSPCQPEDAAREAYRRAIQTGASALLVQSHPKDASMERASMERVVDSHHAA